MINVQELTIKTAREALKKGDFTARELTQACIDTIKDKDPEIHAFLEVYESALAQADEADRKIKAGVDLPLLGVPIAIKDNITIAGHHSSAGSKILEHFVSPTSSTAVQKLWEAGAVIIGRTNCDEFAMGSSTENSAYGVTKNPLDTSRVPGGSSGGSAAAVVAGMCIASLGSDTGGSIRQPAAFTGVVGFKPTYGRVSRSGLIAMASSLDQIGPFTKTVEDVEILYNVLKGEDKMDSTTIGNDIYPIQSEKKVIGVPRSFVNMEGLDSEVKKNFAEVEEKYKKLGFTIKDVDLPHLQYALAAYYIIMPAEVSSNLARFDGVKYGLHVDGANGVDDYFKTRAAGFGKEVRRRVILGTYVLSSGYYDAYYGSALAMKGVIQEELADIFTEVDCIMTPTTPTPAFKIGEKTSDPLSMYLADVFTVPANIAGMPSISVPSGSVDVEGKRLPLGICLTADTAQEEVLFAAAQRFLKNF